MEQVATQVVQQENLIQWIARFMVEGGIFMWIIAIVWCLGIALAAERLRNYFKFDIDGKSLMNTIKKISDW